MRTEHLLAWANEIMALPPTLALGDPPHLERWWVRRDGEDVTGQAFTQEQWLEPVGCNVFVHRFNKPDPLQHDHPWSSVSIMLAGAMTDHWIEGGVEHTRRFVAGEVFFRSAEAVHWVSIAPGEQAISIFITGPWRRDWGLIINGEWTPWQVAVGLRP